MERNERKKGKNRHRGVYMKLKGKNAVKMSGKYIKNIRNESI